MWILTFQAQPTNGFFATVIQMFVGSSQLPITVQCAVIKSSSSSDLDSETVFGGSCKLGEAFEQLIDVNGNAFIA